MSTLALDSCPFLGLCMHIRWCSHVHVHTYVHICVIHTYNTHHVYYNVQYSSVLIPLCPILIMWYPVNMFNTHPIMLSLLITQCSTLIIKSPTLSTWCLVLIEQCPTATHHTVSNQGGWSRGHQVFSNLIHSSWNTLKSWNLQSRKWVFCTSKIL